MPSNARASGPTAPDTTGRSGTSASAHRPANAITRRCAELRRRQSRNVRSPPALVCEPDASEDRCLAPPPASAGEEVLGDLDRVERRALAKVVDAAEEHE